MNRIATNITDIQSTSQLKRLLNKNLNTNSDTTDIFKLGGNREINIILCQLRNNASNLNYDRYKDHLVESPMCDCNHSFETATHYFYECIKYNNIRQTLQQNLNHYAHDHLSMHTLLHGCKRCNDIENRDILSHVSNFILQSNRLLHN